MFTVEERLYLTAQDLAYSYDEDTMKIHESKFDKAIDLIYTKIENRNFDLTDEEAEIIGDAYAVVNEHGVC